MDFSKFSSNEKLMIYGAVAAIVGGLVGGISGVIWISVLAAIALLVVLFLPQFSPQTSLPGTRGSLMIALGGVGAAAAVLAFLIFVVDIGFWFEFAAVRSIFFIIGVAGALLAGWIAWQEFQAEGGKFSMGAAPSGSGAAATSATTNASTADAAPAASAPPPAAPPPAAEPPMGTASEADAADENRPPV
jgi:hypothetical protein